MTQLKHSYISDGLQIATNTWENSLTVSMTITHTSTHCITANLNISQEEMGALTRKRYVQDYNECS